MAICRGCGDEFVKVPGSPGFINQCPMCATDVEKVGGNMVWTHKTAPELEIKSMHAAKAFARLTQRFGAGPLRSIAQSQEQAHRSLTGQSSFGDGDGAGKQGTGAGQRDLYYSRLGEKRSVK